MCVCKGGVIIEKRKIRRKMDQKCKGGYYGMCYLSALTEEYMTAIVYSVACCLAHKLSRIYFTQFLKRWESHTQ